MLSLVKHPTRYPPNASLYILTSVTGSGVAADCLTGPMLANAVIPYSFYYLYPNPTALY